MSPSENWSDRMCWLLWCFLCDYTLCGLSVNCLNVLVELKETEGSGSEQLADCTLTLVLL